MSGYSFFSSPFITSFVDWQEGGLKGNVQDKTDYTANTLDYASVE